MKTNSFEYQVETIVTELGYGLKIDYQTGSCTFVFVDEDEGLPVVGLCVLEPGGGLRAVSALGREASVLFEALKERSVD